MATSNPQTPQIRFGKFEFDRHRGVLKRDGQAIALADKPLAILKAVLETPGDIVPREKLVQTLWGDGTHVDFDNNLNASVRKLREALGDTANASLYLETVPRKGYRFVAPVTLPEPKSAPRAGKLRIAIALFAAVIALAIAAGFWQRASKPGKVMLAILPIRALGDQPDLMPICEGLTQELITQCGRWAPDQLGVIAATSIRQYRTTTKTAAEIGSELGVAYLLETAVQSEGSMLRINAQLIEVSTQSPLWTDILTRETGQLLEMRRSIGLEVTRALGNHLGISGQERPETNLPSALYETYLKACFHLAQGNLESYRQAGQLLQKVVDEAPDLAGTRAKLAEAYNMMGTYSAPPEAEAFFQKALKSAEEALSLQSDHGPAQVNYGFALMYGFHRFQEAGPWLRKALKNAPGDASVHALAAAWFSVNGRHADALEAAANARQLDPLSVSVNRDLAWYYYYAGQFDKALAAADHTRELDQGSPSLAKLLTLWAMGRNEAALDQFESLMSSEEAVRTAFRTQRERSRAAADAWIIEKLGSMRQGLGLYLLANRFAATGQNGLAIEAMTEAYDQKANWVFYAPVDPGFQSLYTDPGFLKLVDALGLPLRLEGHRFVPTQAAFSP